ncbi:ras GTPase-activating protein-binding protein 2 [Octodon degus]|uniref:Ras GTPase-activating protein-binding protein 2 n=1 Tax=Octodon degus TaxID=10160 RepID=A0A6P3VA14_OCTDE|nr:ras GTPase-activating protein-binding protein 2 [Octodon degus]
MSWLSSSPGSSFCRPRMHSAVKDSDDLILRAPERITKTQRLTLCSKEMVMEKPSPLLVGREFVRQYYTLLNKAPEYLHRFYGRNSSYVHGGVDANGKPQEAVYGQNDIHHKVLSLNFSECHTKIRHVDAHATLSDGVVVQVMGLLSNSGQPERKFMQTFVLAPEGSVPNKFYVHNDMFRYEDEVFGDSEPELDEESEDEVEEEQEERQPSPEPVQENANSGYYEALEEKNLEELEEKSTTPPPAEPVSLPQEPPKAFSWASVTSKNLPPSGTVSSSGIPPHVKAPVSQPRVEAKPEVQSQPPRVREQRPRERPGFPPRGPRPGRGDMEQNDSDNRRVIRYPDSHQLFVGNLPHDIDENELKEFFMSFGNVVELRINTKGVGGKLPNFGFVVFDDSEPVQRILIAKPIMFRGEVRLNVEEKKTRAARERETRGGGDDRRDIRRNDRGPGGPRGLVGGGMMRDRDGRGPPPRGGMHPAELNQVGACMEDPPKDCCQQHKRRTVKEEGVQLVLLGLLVLLEEFVTLAFLI